MRGERIEKNAAAKRREGPHLTVNLTIDHRLMEKKTPPSTRKAKAPSKRRDELPTSGGDISEDILIS